MTRNVVVGRVRAGHGRAGARRYRGAGPSGCLDMKVGICEDIVRVRFRA